MAKKTSVGQDFIRVLEARFPKSLAMENDPIGWQVGSGNRKVKKVMLALDVDQSVCAQAVAQNVDLIIAHHPFLFRPLAQVLTDTPKGKIVQQLLKHDISVYAAHTNLDIAPNGLNDWLAAALSVEQTTCLAPTQTTSFYKFVTYIPTTHLEVVQAALLAVQGVSLQGYEQCSFTVAGQGSFQPSQEANPFIGTTGELNFVAEVRLEMLVEAPTLPIVIQTLQAVHPYEVPAFESYPIDQVAKQFGLGRIGTLAKPESCADFVARVKQVFGLSFVRVVGGMPTASIQKVAIMGGSGSGYWRQAKRQGADVYITGDIGYHDAQDAREAGITLIDIGHFAEQICKGQLQQILTEFVQETGADVEIMQATCEADPFQVW